MPKQPPDYGAGVSLVPGIALWDGEVKYRTSVKYGREEEA